MSVYDSCYYYGKACMSPEEPSAVYRRAAPCAELLCTAIDQWIFLPAGAQDGALLHGEFFPYFPPLPAGPCSYKILWELISFPWPCHDPAVITIALHHMGAHIVFQIQLQYLFDPFDVFFIFYREEEFHPVVQVPGHPVGAAHVQLLIPIIGKTRKMRIVFQLSFNNTADGDIVADTFQTGTQGTDAPAMISSISTPAMEASYNF